VEDALQGCRNLAPYPDLGRVGHLSCHMPVDCSCIDLMLLVNLHCPKPSFAIFSFLCECFCDLEEYQDSYESHSALWEFFGEQLLD